MHSQGNSESDQESVIEFHSLTDSIAPMSQTVPTPTLQPELLPQVAVLVANMIESYLDTYHPFGPRMEVKDDQRADRSRPSTWRRRRMSIFVNRHWGKCYIIRRVRTVNMRCERKR